MSHDLIVVIALAWVSGAQMLTQRSDEPFSTQTEVFEIVLGELVVNALRPVPSSSIRLTTIITLPDFVVICLTVSMW